MKVESILNPLVVACQRTESVRDVAGRMSFNDLGSVAVCEGETLVGIITERDLSRAMAEGLEVDSARAEDLMTPDPAFVTPHSPVQDAADGMLRMGFRHMPVVSDGGVVGMISIRDVLADLAWTYDRRK